MTQYSVSFTIPITATDPMAAANKLRDMLTIKHTRKQVAYQDFTPSVFKVFDCSILREFEVDTIKEGWKNV